HTGGRALDRTSRTGRRAPRAGRSPSSRRAHARPRFGFAGSCVRSSSRSGYRAAEVCLVALLLGKARLEVRADGRPLLVRHAVPRAVAVLSLPDEHVVPMNSLERRAERLERPARALVLRIRLPLDAATAPHVERVLHLEEL